MSDEPIQPPVDTTEPTGPIDTTDTFDETELTVLADEFIATVEPVAESVAEEPIVTARTDSPGTNPRVTLRDPVANGIKSEPKPGVVPISITNATQEERSNPNLIPPSFNNQYYSGRSYIAGQRPAKEFYVAPDDIDEQTYDYMDEFVEGTRFIYEEGMESIQEKSFNREGSDWRQGVEYNNKYLTGLSPSIADVSENSATRGQAAIDTAKKIMNVGIAYMMPLWHSGVHVSIQSASNNRLLDLDRQIVEDKINYGYDSRGAIYSSENYQTITRVANFVISNINKSTLNPTDNSDLQTALLNTLLITDIPLLATGQAHLIHINGYPYHTVCTVNPETCKTERDESLLRVNRMIWTDNARLSSKQKDFMADRVKLRTEAEVREYQKELFARIKHNYIELPTAEGTGGLGINFRIPTIEDYRRESEILVNSITSIIEHMPTTNLDEQQRRALFDQHISVCSLRKYSAYVDSIVYVDSKEAAITDRETIRTILSDVLSLDSDNVDKIWLGIKDFMADAYISLVAIPRVPCSKCGKHADPEDKFHPKLIPQDPIELFSTLKDRRLLKAQTIQR